MRSYYVETWGVFLGRVIPCMGGLLCMPSGTGGKLGWTWGYQGSIAALDSIRQEFSDAAQADEMH